MSSSYRLATFDTFPCQLLELLALFHHRYWRLLKSEVVYDWVRGVIVGKWLIFGCGYWHNRGLWYMRHKGHWLVSFNMVLSALNVCSWYRIDIERLRWVLIFLHMCLIYLKELIFNGCFFTSVCPGIKSPTLRAMFLISVEGVGAPIMTRLSCILIFGLGLLV